jgi:hypothetical protein
VTYLEVVGPAAQRHLVWVCGCVRAGEWMGMPAVRCANRRRGQEFCVAFHNGARKTFVLEGDRRTELKFLKFLARGRASSWMKCPLGTAFVDDRRNAPLPSSIVALLVVECEV